MHVACLDMEGVLFPELWVAVAEHSGIDALRATTQDYSDYDELMQMRLEELKKHELGLAEIQALTARVEPLEGAQEFIRRLRPHYQVVILSDTFEEFSLPLMAKLDWPLLLCHRLEIDEQGRIRGYRLRQPDPKRKAVQAFHSLRCRVTAAGDSYNDLGMLEEADTGIWFQAPDKIRALHPEFPAVQDHAALYEEFARARS